MASLLILVSAPVSAFATTILQSGDTSVFAVVADYGAGNVMVDSDLAVIQHAPPGSTSVPASGAGISNPSAFGSASGSGTAGLNSNVFSAHWSGHAHLTNAGPFNDWITAQSFFCPTQGYSWCTNPLWFQLSAPTPITLAARGSVSLSPTGGGESRFSLARATSFNGSLIESTAIDSVTVYSPAGTSDSFDRRLSTTLNPGFYVLSYQSFASADVGGDNAAASLDIVMTLSPVGDCSDGLDNDGDTRVDLDDSNCEDGTTASEATPVPALGTAGRAIALTTILLLTLIRLRARRRA
jgi:hypothetical protein